jgi:hypothetical protein
MVSAAVICAYTVGVVEGDAADVERLAGAPPHVIDALAEQVEHPEPEQVELREPEIGAVVLVPLDDRALRHGGGLDGGDGAQRLTREHEAAGVDSPVPRHLLQPAHQPHQRAGTRLGGLEPDRAECLPPGRFEPVRAGPAPGIAVDSLREPVGGRGGEGERAHRVADRGARAVFNRDAHHRGVRATVPRVDVLQYPLAVVAGGEVDVDVRRLGPLHRDEALEEEVMRHGIHRGDAERVTDERVCRGAAPLAQHSRLPREAAQIPDDQEVVGDPELGDGAELVLELLLV